MNYFRLRHFNEDLGNTVVENVFINHYMPNAPGDFVKIYLLGLKSSCYEGSNCLSDETIAKTVGTSINDVKKAWKYWEEQGIIKVIPSEENDSFFIEFLSIKELMLNIKGEEKKKSKYSADRIISARQNSKTKKMFDYIYRAYGRDLSQNETFAFLDWIDDYNFPPEVVIMVIDHCLSKNIKDLPYLKQVARNWFDAGVDSEKKALEYSEQHKERWQNYSKVLNYLRIKRQPTLGEEKALYKWFYEFSFSDDIILKACELTINTIKPSISYMDKILTDWHDKGLTTINEVEAYQAKASKGTKKTNTKPQKSTFDNFDGRSYDPELLKQNLLKKSRGVKND